MTTPATRPTRLYIAGPMTGLPDFNRPAFHAAAAQLRAAGYEVVSPAELDSTHPIADPDGPGAWGRYMRRDIPFLLECDGVAWLSGWLESKGARLEMKIADELEIEYWGVATWLSVAQRNATFALIRQAQPTAGPTP